jgi:hypothetical protein
LASSICTAFSNPQASSPSGKVAHSGGGDQSRGHMRVLSLNGTEIDLDNVDTGQLSAPAQRQGVSPERLAAAVRAAMPPAQAAPPAPPSKDEIIGRLARATWA